MKAFTCTLVTILTMVWSSAAVALDLTFDDVMSVGNPLVTTLDTHGYHFTGLFRTIDAPGGTLASNGSAVYLGQEASNAQQVNLVGLRVDGGILAASYGLSDLAQFAHFSVPDTWSDLRAATFSGLLAGAPLGALALDDVGVGEGPTSAAELGTLALVTLTALGIGGVALTRRPRASFRPR